MVTHARWFVTCGVLTMGLAVTSGCRTTEEVPARPERRASTPSRPAVGDLGKVGRVDFSTPCDAAVQETFERGIALLHSFFYPEARRLFTEVTERDPDCAIAHWGVAMTWYHPIWTAPEPDEFEAGRAAIERAVQASKKSERDRALIDALVAFYETPEGQEAPAAQSCHGTGLTFPARAAAWAQGMRAAFEKLPGDEEVASFYALSLLGSAVPGDPELRNQHQAAQILEELWAVRKDHPGVTHYLIHAYDYPSLASRGLPAARQYASIAPTVPHALHMPSHIFIRLGMWKDAIDSNLASAAASRDYAAQTSPGAVQFEELHALDYLMYAHLQRGRDDLAREIAQRIPTIKKTAPEVDAVASYAMGSIPARFAVERHAWKEAADLPLSDAPFWATFPHAEAHIEYARGLGRARLGDLDGARRSLARLAELRDATTDPKMQYFRKHLDLQRQAVAAWIAQAEGKSEEAVKMLRKAAALEDKLGKHPVSPGPILPIYEQLGDLLVELERPAEALEAYQAALRTSPKRFGALHGAARAAQLAKKDALARDYYQELVDTADGASQRRELAEARAFLDTKSAR